MDLGLTLFSLQQLTRLLSHPLLLTQMSLEGALGLKCKTYRCAQQVSTRF